MSRGEIASIRVGRLRRVPSESLTDYVAALRHEASHPDPAAERGQSPDGPGPIRTLVSRYVLPLGHRLSICDDVQGPHLLIFPGIGPSHLATLRST